MAEPIYDKSSKWLVEHQGKALAVVGGLKGLVSCKAVHADVVQPRQLPDGLLEVRLKDQKEPVLLLVEFCTYPESRVPQQMHDDIQMVRQARGVLPEVLALVLCPKGQMTVPDRYAEASKLGFTRSEVGWKVQELWKLDANAMLEHPDVGVAVLAPLMRFEGPPEPLLRRCRERIDREGGKQRESLLAVAKVLAGVRFVEQGLLDLFLRSEAMIESPVIKDIHDSAVLLGWRKAIESALASREMKLSPDGRARLAGLKDEAAMEGLLRLAMGCPTLEAFAKRLEQETTPAPKPASSRRKRKD